MQMTVGATAGSRRLSTRPISGRMRHFRLWLLMIGVLSLVAEAVAAAAVFGPRRLSGRAPVPGERTGEVMCAPAIFRESHPTTMKRAGRKIPS